MLDLHCRQIFFCPTLKPWRRIVFSANRFSFWLQAEWGGRGAHREHFVEIPDRRTGHSSTSLRLGEVMAPGLDSAPIILEARKLR